MRTIRTDEATRLIQAKLASGFSVAAACKAAKIGRSSYYEWLADDPEFAAIVAEAIEDGTDKLEDSCVRQAFQGNTSLMVLLLKARRPGRFKDRSVTEHTGADGGPIMVSPGINLAKLSDEDLALYEQITAKASTP